MISPPILTWDIHRVASHPSLRRSVAEPARRGGSLRRFGLPSCLLLLITLPSFAAGNGAYDQLVELVNDAPARQVGQPGNELVDRMIRERFEAAAEKANAGRAAQIQQAQELLQQAQDANQRVLEAKSEFETAVQEGAGKDSPWYVRYTLEEPTPAVFVFAVLLVMTGASWRVQRRQSLLVAAGCCAGVVVLLPLVALFVKTEAERIRIMADRGDLVDPNEVTTEVLQDRVRNVAFVALEADKKAAEALRGLWQYGQIKFPGAVFIPGAATLKVDGRQVPLYQMAPNLIEPANLPAEGYQGRLIYGGGAETEDLAPIDAELAGAAVLLEFNCSKRWQQPIRRRAELIVFIEPPSDAAATLTQAILKYSVAPLSIPRFYIKRDDLADVFGEDWKAALSAGRPIRIDQPEPGRWERRIMATHWLFIPGTSEPAEPGTDLLKDPGRQLIHLQTYVDSNSIVPALSPGANSAGNIVLMMRLLDEFEQQPPQRPVLISVANHHGNMFQGEEEFAYAALADAGNALWEQLDSLEQQFAQARFKYETLHEGPNSELLERMRNEVATVAGKKFKTKQPVQDHLASMRSQNQEERSRLVARLNTLDVPTANSDQRTEIEDSIAHINRKSQQVERLMRLFNQFGRDKLHFDELDEDDSSLLTFIFEELANEAEKARNQIVKTRDMFFENLSIRKRLRYLTDRGTSLGPEASYKKVFADQYRPVPGTVGLCLDLSFNTDHVGFFHSGYANNAYFKEAAHRTGALVRYTVRVAREFAVSTNSESLFTDTLTLKGGYPWNAHLGGRFAMASRILNQHDVAALTLTSLHDARPHTFSPFDTPDRIDPENFDRVMHFVQGYLSLLVNSEELARQPRQIKNGAVPMSVEISVRMQERMSKDVPKQTVPNAVVVRAVTLSGDTQSELYTRYGQVSPCTVMMSDDHGAAFFRGGVYRSVKPLAFTYDPDFRHVTAARDAGSVKRSETPPMDARTTQFVERKVVVHPFHKVDLLGLTSPLTLAPAKGLRVIDARQNGTARHFAVVGVGVQSAHSPKNPTLEGASSKDGTASIFVEPETFFKLQIENAVAINAPEVGPDDSPDLMSTGYPADVGMLHDVLANCFRDMTKLTEHRVRLLEQKGVTSASVTDTNNEAKEAVHDTAGDRTSPLEYGFGVASRAYVQGRGIVNDLVTAVVIFMALVIPFCFFVMKLITPYTDVNRQIALFGAVFVGMVALLYVVHPAFAIADTPIVVVLSFIILGLAALVSMVLIGRFNASMNQLVEQVLQSESSEASQSRLAEAAFLVGVSNMKRRRIRTTLTCATIILVTFTMLSVISVGQDVDPVMIKEAPQAAYNGFIFTRPGMGKIPQLQLERIRARFSRDAIVAPRAWGMLKDTLGAYMPFELRLFGPPGGDVSRKTLYPKAVLGLDHREDGLVKPMPLKAGRWFSSNDAPEIVLSVKAAKLLGITPDRFAEQELTLYGTRLKLIGLLDDQRMEDLEDLSETPVLPLRFEVYADPAAKSAASRTELTSITEETYGTADLTTMELPTDQVFDPINVAFLPVDLAVSIGNAAYRSLSVKFDDVDEQAAAQRAWDEANRMIRFQHLRLAVGLTQSVQRGESAPVLNPGEYALTSSSSMQVGGVLKVAIPIILAATIILNTMLGSVMERKREVGIYNAIGLNPGHVMTFFLAESLVFGIVGSVAGYLIGQTLSITITRFDLIELNLNYSSMAVVVVIFLTVATVLISTIYPAMMAARAAVPSGQRRWSLPRPEGDQIKVDFPFSYDATRVLAVYSYLYDFMSEHTEASTGKFLARNALVGFVPVVEEGRQMTEDGGQKIEDGGQRSDVTAQAEGDDSQTTPKQEKAYTMLFDVAPAPFDLGVNQKMEIYACYNRRVRAHMLTVHLTHVSGLRSSWLTVNQPFLEALRKRLLAWRSQPEDIQKNYFAKGEQLFAHATDLPVLSGTAPQERSG